MINKKEIEDFGRKTLGGILSKDYEGKVYLCGGAFKSALRSDLAVNDIDLWVDDKHERCVLLQHLVTNGASLTRDYAPYCIKLERASTAVEITYQSVRHRPVSWIVDGFDLAICSIGLTYSDDEVVELYVEPEAERSVAEEIVYLNPSHLEAVEARKLPTILRTLDRMERTATELGYRPSLLDTVALWRLYESYTSEQRRECIHVYLETMVDYKGCCNTELTKTAIRRIKTMRRDLERETRRTVSSRELEELLA